MLFKYTSINDRGEQKTGSIEALNKDVAISALQRRGLIISSVVEAEKGSFLENRITFFERIKNKDIVILSRQISTLFDAKVSALRVFRLLSGEAERPALRKVLSEVADDLQGGSSISKALAQHPDAFSIFYSNMVKAGEESGKLDETFLYLADYLDRVYETTSKVRSAMVYPAFIIITFVGVMILMLTTV
ncbi:MAG: type IV pilus assembly protein PilC, partial [Parcubacteria group bacterium Gr01-1014_48]